VVERVSGSGKECPGEEKREGVQKRGFVGREVLGFKDKTVIITPSLIPVLHAISSFQRARLVKPQNSM
jgi:hypothetical protein